MFYASYPVSVYDTTHPAPAKVTLSPLVRLSQFHAALRAARRHLVIYDEPGGLFEGTRRPVRMHTEVSADMNSYMHPLSQAACCNLTHTHTHTEDQVGLVLEIYSISLQLSL